MNPNYINVRFRAEIPEDGLPPQFGVITACNPEGRTVAVEKNHQANESLLVALNEAKHRFFSVTGGSSDFTHAEPGFGVLFASREEAISWGRRYRQEAIFWIVNETVELVPCDGGISSMLGNWQSLVEEVPSREAGQRIHTDH